MPYRSTVCSVAPVAHKNRFDTPPATRQSEACHQYPMTCGPGQPLTNRPLPYPLSRCTIGTVGLVTGWFSTRQRTRPDPADRLRPVTDSVNDNVTPHHGHPLRLEPAVTARPTVRPPPQQICVVPSPQSAERRYHRERPGSRFLRYLPRSTIGRPGGDASGPYRPPGRATPARQPKGTGRPPVSVLPGIPD